MDEQNGTQLDTSFDDIDPSLLNLPISIRKKAIEAFLSRKSKPQIPEASSIETYEPSQASITDFNQMFPLGNIFQRWKNGIPIYPTTKHSVGKIRDEVDPIKTQVIKNLLEAGIISPTSKRASFLSNFFLVSKGANSVRPIMDYSHLTRHLKSPHFVLPSVYQVIRNKFLDHTNLFYIKVDLKAAFFNIPLKQSSKFVTTFIYNGQRFTMNRLPMGLSISPFVMQRFLNAIIKKYQHLVNFAWGHIDDILMASKSATLLKSVALALVADLSAINWRISWKKSNLIPSRGIEYLGAVWGQHFVTRKPSVTEKLKLLWDSIKYRPLTIKELQRVRGTFNYYFGFAGFYHAVVNRILKQPDKFRYSNIIKFLIKSDSIRLNVSVKKPVVAYADASLYRIAS